jgi:hypothetical protein
MTQREVMIKQIADTLRTEADLEDLRQIGLVPEVMVVTKEEILEKLDETLSHESTEFIEMFLEILIDDTKVKH